MIEIDIPAKGRIEIKHILFDYNGTIAEDGQLLPSVKENINAFGDRLDFHVITADTFGSVAKQMEDVRVNLAVISNDDQDQKKLDFLNTLGPKNTLSVGNGVNDTLILKHSVVGIAVLGAEGVATSALLASDVLVRDVLDVFAFLKTPERLIATLRK